MSDRAANVPPRCRETTPLDAQRSAPEVCVCGCVSYVSLCTFDDSYDGMRNAERREIALRDLATATKQGLDGSASDTFLEGRSWDVDISTDDSHPDGSDSPSRVHVWHGGDDNDVPVEAGQYLATTLRVPPPQAHFIDGENHTLIRRHWQHILETLVRATGTNGVGDSNRAASASRSPTTASRL